MNNNYYDDYIVANEELIDIASSSSGNNAKNNKRYSQNNKQNKNGKNKKPIIIASVCVAVVAVLGVTGFCLYQSGVFTPKDPDAQFVFAEDTTVSGVSIAGMTMEQAKAMLESMEDTFVAPVNISVDVNGKVTNLTEDDFEYTFDIDKVLDIIKSDAEDENSDNDEKIYEITATVTEDSIQQNAKTIEKQTNKEAKNAYVSKFTPYSENRFEYTDAVDGCKLNTDDLNEQLQVVFASKVSEQRIVADVETVEAKITTEDIKNNVKKLSSYETVSTNTANGTSNMKVSLEACNGSVIEPGETWSFNECTGDSNLESNGYKSAHVISDGKIVDGIGGGICQSSSTIYNAAIKANMDIEERYCHKWASVYVPTGLDATIDYPRLDLKLSNPTEYQMFMECKLEDSTLYVSIWGYKSDSYDEIKTHNELTSRDSSSYTVKAWRIYMKDGKEVDRESLGSSTYDNDNGIIFISADSSSDVSNKTTQKPDSSSSKASSSSSSSSKTEPATKKPTQPATQKPTEPATEATEAPVTSSEVSEVETVE